MIQSAIAVDFTLYKIKLLLYYYYTTGKYDKGDQPSGGETTWTKLILERHNNIWQRKAQDRVI